MPVRFQQHRGEPSKHRTAAKPAAGPKAAPALAIAAAGVWLSIGSARSQELEPRAYSASPIGTNFLVSGYTRTSGRISLDPSLPITGVRGTIDTATLGYDRTFDLAGRTASAAIQLPYVHGDFSGQVEEGGAHFSVGAGRPEDALRREPLGRPRAYAG